MDKKTFLKDLSFFLQDIDEEERLSALEYYENYFDEAGVENEEEVIKELGSASEAAKKIKEGLNDFQDIGEDSFKKSSQYEVQKTFQLKSKWKELNRSDQCILIALALICFLPISKGRFDGILNIFFVLLMLLFLLVICPWVISICFSIIAIGFIAVGVLTSMKTLSSGLILIGIGFIAFSMSHLMNRLSAWIFKDVFPTIKKSIIKIFHGGKV